MTIKATGQHSGKKLTVEYADGIFLFDGKRDVFYEDEIRYQLDRRPPFGGTYYPEKDGNLNIYNVIQNHFFDRTPVLDVLEDADFEEMESVPGRIY